MDTPISLLNERISELCGLLADLRQEMVEMRKDMTKIRADLTAVQVDVAWLKRAFWWGAGLAGSALVTGGLAIALR